MLGNKTQDRGKKKFQGARNLGGTFGGNAKKGVEQPFWGECWGSCEPQQILGGEFLEKCQRKKFIGEILGGSTKGACQKRGGKTLWRFQKVVGIILGVTTIFGGRIFQEKF